VEISRSIARRSPTDIKCINYFRFWHFTLGQNATYVQEEIEEEMIFRKHKRHREGGGGGETSGTNERETGWSRWDQNT